MTDALRVSMPLLNPNEPELQVSALAVAEGELVNRGQLICTVESTKSATELYAEQEGYIIGLLPSVGDTLRAGTRICWIAPQADWTPPAPEISQDPGKPGEAEGLRITAPARQLAAQLGIDLSGLPVGPLITEASLQSLQTAGSLSELEPPAATDGRGKVLIYGGGGHGKSILDLIRTLEGYEIAGFIDDQLKPGTEIMGIEVIGSGEDLAEFLSSGIHLAVNAVGGVGDVMSRFRIFQKLIAAGFSFPCLIHPTAFVENSAVLEAGVQVFPHAYVGSEARVGFGSIVNTGAIISHDCQLSRYVNIAPGACLAGDVCIGKSVLVGMSVTVNLSVSVGDYARIGNSAVIKGDVPREKVIRAGAIWP
jgi:sugar O-acyltransferase (sialic acid O-acetyltransferase NeuD family)